MNQLTPGRIVLYSPPHQEGRHANGAEEYVALIGQTWPDSHFANLVVFPPFTEPKWVGSVSQHETPNELPQGSFRFPPRV